MRVNTSASSRRPDGAHPDPAAAAVAGQAAARRGAPGRAGDTPHHTNMYDGMAHSDAPWPSSQRPPPFHTVRPLPPLTPRAGVLERFGRDDDRSPVIGSRLTPPLDSRHVSLGDAACRAREGAAATRADVPGAAEGTWVVSEDRFHVSGGLSAATRRRRRRRRAQKRSMLDTALLLSLCWDVRCGYSYCVLVWCKWPRSSIRGRAGPGA